MSIFSFETVAPKLPGNGKYWIAESANVIGNVELNENTSVWFGAVIRGDNERISVGTGSNIQENCIIHTDIGYPVKIGKNCTIGHGAILHGCSIGNNCIIGMGSIILNGAKIGDNCIVGAGALITEAKIFLENKKLMLGSPGKVVRNLREEEIHNILDSALGYQAKAEIFKETLKKVCE